MEKFIEENKSFSQIFDLISFSDFFRLNSFFESQWLQQIDEREERKEPFLKSSWNHNTFCRKQEEKHWTNIDWNSKIHCFFTQTHAVFLISRYLC